MLHQTATINFCAVPKTDFPYCSVNLKSKALTVSSNLSCSYRHPLIPQAPFWISQAERCRNRESHGPESRSLIGMTDVRVGYYVCGLLLLQSQKFMILWTGS